MKTEKKLLLAFLLNTAFAVFEIFGGILTGSSAILSDALHDFCDALGIMLTLLFEKKSQKNADDTYPYGYGRFSVLGGLISAITLFLACIGILLSSLYRLFVPTDMEYGAMILFAIVGILLNGIAALITTDKKELGEKAVHLHLLEDVLSWVVVLIGAIVMYITDISILDPILSIGIAITLLVCAVRMILQGMEIFLEKTPADIHPQALRQAIRGIEGVADVLCIRVTAIRANRYCATVKITAHTKAVGIRQDIIDLLHMHGMEDVTVDIADCYDDESPFTFPLSPDRHHH